MSKELSLGKLTILYTAGNLASKIISFALFFVYTFYLSQSDLGLFDIIITTTSLIAPVISFQLYDALFRWALDTKEEQVLRQAFTGGIVVLLIGAFFFSIFFLVSRFFFEIPYSFLIYLLILLQSLYQFFPQFARGLNKNLIYVISGVLYSFVFTIFTIVLLVVFKANIEGLLIANIAAIIVAIVYISIKIDVLSYLKWEYVNWKCIKDMISFSVPLIPNTLSWWAISTSNRYVILYYIGLSANGLFAVALKLPSILLMMVNIFNQAWIEKAIKTYNTHDRDQYYTSVLEQYVCVLFTSIIVLITISKPFLMFLVDEAYFEAWKFMPILYLAVGFQALSAFYGTGYISSKNTKGALKTTIYGAATTVMSSFVLIPLIGLLGAAISFLIGYLVMFVVRVFKAKKYFTVRFPLRTSILLIILIGIVSWISVSSNLFVIAANFILSCIIFLSFNRKILVKYINIIRAKFLNKTIRTQT